jgi:RimJ/RimL family protein N-acetyltransferase
MRLLLETERLFLRQFKESDLESFWVYRNDPEVARYQGWDIPYPREKAITFVEAMQVAIPMQSKWLQIAIELKSTHEMIGDVAFFIMRNDARQALIGYSLARPCWGNGYAFEALSRLLAFLFEELNLHRVVAECDVENRPSWRLLEKRGFRREAHLVENTFFKGAYVSEYHYAILGQEWKSRRSMQPEKTSSEG